MNIGLELKGLKTRRSKLDGERRALNQEIGDLSGRRKELENSIRAIDRDITRLTSSGPIVTEHAIIRFLERGMGMDMEEIRKHILTDNVKGVATGGGSGQVPVSHRCRAVIKNGTIVSIVGGEFTEGA